MRTIDLPLEERMKLHDRALRLRKKKHWGAYRVARKLGISRGTADEWLYKGFSPRKPKLWMVGTEELKRLYLHEEKTTREIAKIFGVCKTTVLYWFEKFGIPKRHPYPHPAKIPDLTITPTFAYVIGVVLGDGSVIHHQKSGQWKVKLLQKRGEFAQSFHNALNELGFKTNTFKGKYFLTQTYSVVLSKNILKFKREPMLLLPILSEDRTLATNFLKGFYESEGSLEKDNGRYHIRIWNTNEDLIELCGKLLNSMGYHPMFHHRKRKKPWKDILDVTLYRQDEVGKFLEGVNPCIKNLEGAS